MAAPIRPSETMGARPGTLEFRSQRRSLGSRRVHRLRVGSLIDIDLRVDGQVVAGSRLSGLVLTTVALGPFDVLDLEGDLEGDLAGDSVLVAFSQPHAETLIFADGFAIGISAT